MSESSMNSYCAVRHGSRDRRIDYTAYLSHIRTYLPDLRKELDRCQPLIVTEPCLSRKVMDMLYESVQKVLESWIRTL